MSTLKKLNIKKNNSGACTGFKNWIKTNKENHITSINPATGKPIAQVNNASREALETVIKLSQENFESWRMLPAPKRGEIIRQIGEKLREKKSALGDLVALEMGKSKQEADGEVQEMIDMADLAAGQSRMLYGKTMHSERPQHRMYEQWHPLGPVGVITAFNFPVAVWAWNAFIAAVCGNTVIWKPSPKTPLCAIAVQEICNTVMKENNITGIFSLFITDEVELAKKFVADKRIPLISFTGSSTVGAKISQAVAERMGRCLLECSGNNALIIDQSANLEVAIPAIVFGAIGTAGQRCTSTRRVIIHHSLENKVTDALVNAYQKIKIGDPLDTKNHMGPLIDEDSVNLYKKAIERLQELNADILVGGNAINAKGFFVEPTIARVQNHWDIVQTETFAPILYLMTFKSIEDAIALQNDVPQGLSSAIFTDSVQHAELFLSAKGSDCGIANLNIGTSGAEIGGAFGGEKETGGGREAGSDAWKAYMRRQTNTINWGDTLPLAQGIRFEI